jgi:hypothetical protein
MFYKALGFAVWMFAVAYVRRRYARQAKVAAALAAVTVVGAVYLATRSSDE